MGLEKPYGLFNLPFRVEFSKPNIEISITVTKASKPRSLEAAYKEYKNKKIKILWRSIGPTMQQM